MARRKPRLLFCWELGARFGHAAKIEGIVRALGGRAEVSVAARFPTEIRALAPDLPVRLLPAPQFPPPRGGEPPLSYPDALRASGWGDADALSALVEAWEGLFALAKPDLIVIQAAPTALLAARAAGRPAAMVGGGFDAPPRARPMPPFFFWREALHAEAAAREAPAVAAANAALARRRARPLEAFADLLDGAEPWLLAAWPELDHYGDRSRFEPGGPPHLGQIAALDRGAEAEWRPGARRRILAYLQPSGPAAEAGFAALAGLGPGDDAILACPGADAALASRFAGTPVRLVPGPVRLDRLLPETDLGLGHGSSGFAGALLAAGVPQLSLPVHAEQVMVARALGEAGIGLGLAGRYGAAEAGRAMEDALASVPLRARARAAAARAAAREEIGPRMRAQVAALEAIRAALPDARIVGDSTQPVYAGNLWHEAPAPGLWFNSATGFGTLGYAPGAAIGAALGDPGRPTVCLVGDGGLQFSPAELGTARDEGAGVIFLVWNNAGYGEIERAMREAGAEPIGVRPSPPDLAALAAAFGLPYARVERIADLPAILRAAARPSVVELPEAVAEAG